MNSQRGTSVQYGISAQDLALSLVVDGHFSFGPDDLVHDYVTFYDGLADRFSAWQVGLGPDINLSLRQACAGTGYNLKDLRFDLAWYAQPPSSEHGTGKRFDNRADLIEHLIKHHHNQVWSEVPRVGILIQALGLHLASTPEAVELAKTYIAWALNMLRHVRDLEDNLFPVARLLESLAHMENPRSCPDLPESVLLMERQQQSLIQALTAMRTRLMAASKAISQSSPAVGFQERIEQELTTLTTRLRRMAQLEGQELAPWLQKTHRGLYHRTKAYRRDGGQDYMGPAQALRQRSGEFRQATPQPGNEPASTADQMRADQDPGQGSEHDYLEKRKQKPRLKDLASGNTPLSNQVLPPEPPAETPTSPVLDVPEDVDVPNVPGYVIQRYLASGGAGHVFYAIQEDDQRPVAIKIIRSEYAQVGAIRDRFLREINLLTRLANPRIVRVRDAGVYEDTLYVVQEFLPGGDLWEQVDRYGPLPERQVAKYAADAARALAAVHRAGLVHRDVKPSNLLLDHEGRVVLGDFSLVGWAEGVGDLTLPGQAFGTPSYMAPEQVRAEKHIDIRADIYGLGATLFTLLTARKPYEDARGVDVSVLILTQPFPDVRQFRPDLSRHLATIITKATRAEPDRRYDSPGEMLDDLLLAF